MSAAAPEGSSQLRKSFAAAPNERPWMKWALPVFLYLALLPLTVNGLYYVVIDNHWLGSEAAYDYWLAKGFQWGPEITQNIGPLGFAHFPLSFTGYLDLENTIANFIFSGVLVAQVIYIASRMRSRLGKVGLIGAFAVMQWFKDPGFSMPAEVNHYLVTLFTAYLLFSCNRTVIIIPAVALLAFMALGKGMFLFLSISIILPVTVFYLMKRRFMSAALTVASYVAGLVIFWCAAGQQLQNLPVFLVNSVVFVSGYNNNLVNHAPGLLWPTVFHATMGAVIGTLLVRKHLPGIRDLLRLRLRPSLLLGSIEAFFLFVAWKHAVISADRYHLGIFFVFVTICIFPYAAFLPEEEQKTPAQPEAEVARKRWFGPDAPGLWHIRISLILLAVACCLMPNFASGLRYLICTGEVLAEGRAELKKSIRTLELPAMKKVVGAEKVGYFGEYPAPMMYNDFAFEASPCTISFGGANAWLINMDKEFYGRDDKAPRFLVLQLLNNTTDVAEQFVPQDNSPAQLEIFRKYDPVTNEAGIPIQELGRLLLERRKPREQLEFKEILQRTCRLDEWVDIPSDLTDPVQLRVDTPPVSLVGRLVSFLYKATGYTIEFELSNGTSGRRRFTPAKAKAGFIISPLILFNDHYLAALSGQEWEKYQTGSGGLLPRVKRFRIHCEGLRLGAAEKLEVHLSTIHGLEFGRWHKRKAEPQLPANSVE